MIVVVVLFYYYFCLFECRKGVTSGEKMAQVMLRLTGHLIKDKLIKIRFKRFCYHSNKGFLDIFSANSGCKNSISSMDLVCCLGVEKKL